MRRGKAILRLMPMDTRSCCLFSRLELFSSLDLLSLFTTFLIALCLLLAPQGSLRVGIRFSGCFRLLFGYFSLLLEEVDTEDTEHRLQETYSTAQLSTAIQPLHCLLPLLTLPILAQSDQQRPFLLLLPQGLLPQLVPDLSLGLPRMCLSEPRLPETGSFEGESQDWRLLGLEIAADGCDDIVGDGAHHDYQFVQYWQFMQLLRALRPVFRFATEPLRTETFHRFTNKQLATPEMVRLELIKRIPLHSRVSQVSLYHGKRVRHAIKTCFSEKKTKKFKRVHKLKRYVFSEILNRKLFVRFSMRAYKSMQRYGSFDKYILLTSPKKLDSKMGEYYRALMMRKVNDPTYRVPYVIGSGKVDRIRKFHRYQQMQDANKLIIPKDFKKKLMTFQRKFGTTVDQFAEEDYQKYLEVERLKKLWGKDVDNKHPLLLEIEKKLDVAITPDEMAAMEEKAEFFKQQYLNHPKNKKLRQQSYEYNERELERENTKARQAFLKHELYGEADKSD